MRLLVATDQWYPDTVGGSARVAAGTAQALAARGHEVVVLAPRQRGLPEVARERGVEIHRRCRRGAVPQTFADVEETWRAARALGAGFDVVVAHQATNAVGLLSARLRRPLVLVFHASVSAEQRLNRSRLGGRRLVASLALHPFLRLFERAAVRGAASVLTLSDFSRDLLVATHPGVEERAVRVSGGVDTTEFTPPAGDERAALRERLGVAEGTRLLLTVRRLEPRMGLEELLQATRILLDDGTRIRLVVAGDGSLDGRLRTLADSLRLGDAVRFAGRVHDRELHELYRAADLFVLPTLAYEGFGIATVEALASGCPVIGTPVGATPELLRPLAPGLVAGGTEPAQIATAVSSGLDLVDAAFRRRCADYARGRFGWPSVIVAWEEALTRAGQTGARTSAAS